MRKLSAVCRLFSAASLITLALLTPLRGFAQERPPQETAPTRNLWPQHSDIVGITGTDGALLHDRPGGAVIQAIELAQTITVSGRTADHGWLFVTLTDATTGWVIADEVVIFGIDRLPVVEMMGSGTEGSGTEGSGTEGSGTEGSGTVDSGTVDGGTVDSGTVDDTVDDMAVGEGSTETAAIGMTGQVMVRDSRLNIRAGPATSYLVIGKAQPAAVLTLLGRNEAGDWVQIALDPATGDAPTDAFGWVAGRYLATDDLMALPVVGDVSTAPALPAVGTGSSEQQTITETATTASAQTATTHATGLTGTLVFQSSPGGMLYAYRLETGQLWTLTNGFDPAISSDGKTVAFVREGGENGVYLIDIDGSNERAIFTGRTRLSSPKWSPDGNWILFTRSDEYSECVNFGRGGCLDVNALPPGLPTDTLELSKEYEYNLAAVDTNGNNYHDIAALESARVADWNEAGIVYQSSAGLQITADKPDAENRLLLFIPLQPPHEDPDWQPNGGKVAFVQHHGSHYEIFTINADGSGMTPLTRPVSTLVNEMPNNLAPAWSPDGQHIVFLSNRDVGNEAGAWRIWVMDADGSNQRPLPIDVAINYSYGNEQAVSWGPSSS